GPAAGTPRAAVGASGRHTVSCPYAHAAAPVDAGSARVARSTVGPAAGQGRTRLLSRRAAAGRTAGTPELAPGRLAGSELRRVEVGRVGAGTIAVGRRPECLIGVFATGPVLVGPVAVSVAGRRLVVPGVVGPARPRPRAGRRGRLDVRAGQRWRR